jgi:hypothetical protein
MAQKVECLPNKHKVLRSKLSNIHTHRECPSIQSTYRHRTMNKKQANPS